MIIETEEPRKGFQLTTEKKNYSPNWKRLVSESLDVLMNPEHYNVSGCLFTVVHYL